MKVCRKYIAVCIKGFLSLLFFFLLSTYYQLPAHAIVDPLSVPNNKFGIHIIQATPDESSPAAQLVNTNGDWGYITFLIESKDRNHSKWQEFFNDLRRRHLIPIVRLATKPLNEHWERPYEGEEEAVADFLNNLNWPVKNRYVVIYNEPNHGKEWGNSVDAKSYARVLDKTIAALKSKNEDFFVMNAGFDASAPSKPPEFEDELKFLRQMNEEVSGIFNKLDGWISHSYPNPAFSGSPNAIGRGSIRGWVWEMQLLRSLGVTKNLPVFITETGWKHAEGINHDPSLHKADTVSGYYRIAFEDIWSSNQIVAVTPFILSYQETPFDHFSFKKITGEGQKNRVLGTQFPEYYPQYQTILDMPKVLGSPAQEHKAQLTKGEIFSSLVANQSYDIFLTFKNTGQSIWYGPAPDGAGQVVKLVPIQGGSELGIETQEMEKGRKIEPGKDYIFHFRIKAPQSGKIKVVLNLFAEEKEFDSPPFEFETEVKQPVILKIKNSLKWKKYYSGDYILTVEGAVGESLQKVKIDENGLSDGIEARNLLPDYAFDFTLEKPNYKAVKVRSRVSAGVNVLDFGELQPKLLATIVNPKEFWNLLPFSN